MAENIMGAEGEDQRGGPGQRISGRSIASLVGVCLQVPLGCCDRPGGCSFLPAWYLSPVLLSLLPHRLWIRNVGCIDLLLSHH